MTKIEDFLGGSLDPAVERARDRMENFRQANASLALEGLHVDAVDVEVQRMIASGEITPDDAVAFYVSRIKRSV